MDCRDARELLHDELDGRIALADAQRLAEHVATCAACAAERRELASMRAAFRAMPRATAPEGFRDDVMSALPRGRLRSLPRTLGWIAAVAAMVVVGVTLVPRDRPPAERAVAKGFERLNETVSEGESDAAARSVPLPAARRADDAPSGARDGGAAGPSKSAAPAEPATEAGARAAGDDRDAAADRDEDASGAASDGLARQVPGPIVRYVVFQDAAAASRFADELAAGDAADGKHKKQPAADPPSAGLAAPAAKPEEKSRAKADAPPPADLLKEVAYRSRRIVARQTVASVVDDADLAARAERAGGTLVPDAEAPRLVALLDAPLAPETALDAAKSKDEDEVTEEPRRRAEAKGGETKAGDKRVAETAVAETAVLAGARRIVVVIVVLDPPAPLAQPAGGPR